MQDDFDLEGLSVQDARTYVLRFVTALKQIEPQRATAQADVERWRNRVQLAEENGRPELAAQAKLRLEEAAEKLQKLTHEQHELGFKVTELKRRLANLAEQPKMSVDAQALAEQLESVVGTGHQTDAQTEDLEAQLALEELKRKMSGGES